MSADELTSRLRDLRYYDGPFEAWPSPGMLEALRRFQRDQGLQVTGYADPETIRTAIDLLTSGEVEALVTKTSESTL